jgi:hypothetical protein
LEEVSKTIFFRTTPSQRRLRAPERNTVLSSGDNAEEKNKKGRPRDSQRPRDSKIDSESDKSTGTVDYP